MRPIPELATLHTHASPLHTTTFGVPLAVGSQAEVRLHCIYQPSAMFGVDVLLPPRSASAEPAADFLRIGFSGANTSLVVSHTAAWAGGVVGSLLSVVQKQVQGWWQVADQIAG